MVVDASGNSIVTGHFYGTVNFGGGNLTSVGPTDIFVVKFSAAGVHQWSQSFGGAGSQAGVSVATDATDNVLIAGVALTGFDFDISVIKLNPAGVPRWNSFFGGALDQYANSVAADAMGNVVLTGYFSGAVDFGGGSLTSAGSADVFVAKFAPGDEPTIVDVTDVDNDQGRQVKIRFERSGLDDPASGTPIEQYEAYLRSDLASVIRTPGALRRRCPASASEPPGWTYVGVVPAHAEGTYEIYAPTLGGFHDCGRSAPLGFLHPCGDGVAVRCSTIPRPTAAIRSTTSSRPCRRCSRSIAGDLAWEASDGRLRPLHGVRFRHRTRSTRRPSSSTTRRIPAWT